MQKPARQRSGAGQARDTGLASMGQMVRRLLEMHGLDAVGIARRTGVDLAEIPGPTDRIEAEKFDAILRSAMSLIQDPAFGLQAARCWHPANLGVLGHAWLSSSTLREGLGRLARYSALVGQRADVRIAATKSGVKVAFARKAGDPMITAVVADIALGLLLDMCRMNAGAALRPIAASLRRSAADHAEVYERFFGCPVRFGAEENAFVLSAGDADRPLPSSNRQLAAVFDRLLTEELARLDKRDVVARCRAVVLERLASGEASAEEAARNLHMSARTLQRKLAEADTTYLGLVDDTRRDLALRYVEDPHRSLTDIAFTLGFSQQSALTRAFKRWTGRSPSEYRAKAATRAAA